MDDFSNLSNKGWSRTVHLETKFITMKRRRAHNLKPAQKETAIALDDSFAPRRTPLQWLLHGVVQNVRFIDASLRSPVVTGAIVPSSPALARAMIRGFDLANADAVVELGPGTGAFTEDILQRVGTRTTFFALELNTIYARTLRRRFPDLKVYADSAEHIGPYLARHGKSKADYVISGLPWASIPDESQDRILSGILGSLRPGGVFTTFGYLPFRLTSNAIRFNRKIKRNFSKVEVSEVVWRNLPPALVYRCTM